MKVRLISISVLMLILVAVASAGTIQDIRTGVVPVGSVVEVPGCVVTAVVPSKLCFSLDRLVHPERCVENKRDMVSPGSRLAGNTISEAQPLRLFRTTASR